MSGLTFTIEDFPARDPLERMRKQYIHNQGFVRTYAKYELQLEYLKAIWQRLKEDLEGVTALYLLQQELGKFPVGHTFSPEQNSRYDSGLRAESLLSLDWDSFIIHASILMDTIGHVAVSLLPRSEKVPNSRSFSDQKKYFLRPENKPFLSSEKYASLIRERTDWYDLRLKPARDTMVVHAFRSPGGMMFSPIRGKIRLLRQRYITEFDMNAIHNQLLELKEKHERANPELQTMTNFWELVDFFMTHEMKTDAREKAMIARIIGTTGGYMPDLSQLVRDMFTFLEEVVGAFAA